ncbi:hypothetical protein [Nocardia nova]
MTTTTEIRTMNDVIRAGWAVLIDGAPLLDIDADTDELAIFPTEEAANAAGLRILAAACDFYGVPGIDVATVPARHLGDTEPVPFAERTAPADDTELNIRYAAPEDRTTTEYAIRLPSNRLYRDADDMARGREFTAYRDEEEAADALAELTASAHADGIRGFTATVAARTITTSYTDWA